MTRITLYTGGGVSFSPQYAEGRVESSYIRLVADEGKILINNDRMAICVDIPRSEASNWSEVDGVLPSDDASVPATVEGADV